MPEHLLPTFCVLFSSSVYLFLYSIFLYFLSRDLPGSCSGGIQRTLMAILAPVWKYSCLSNAVLFRLSGAGDHLGHPSRARV